MGVSVAVVLLSEAIEIPGDGVGHDAQERIRVAYADSAFGSEGQVMQLRYEAPRKA